MSDNPYEAPISLESQEPEIDSIQLASRFKRLVARIIDGLLLAICIALPVGFLIGIEASMPRFVIESDPSDMSSLFGMLWTIHNLNDLLAFILGVLGTFVLQGYLLKTYGQTIGKRILNLKILMLDTNEIPTLGQSFGIREFGIMLIGIVPIAALIDVLFIFGSERRCLHDYWSRTIVVNAD